MRRKIYQELLQWKQRSGESALLVQGARRVGKSYIVEAFAKAEYKSYILIDFNLVDQPVKEMFEHDLVDLKTFFMKLTTYYGVKLYERESLIIFDEVQLFPRARSAIKYLVADGRYDYIETGSLISIRENVKDILIPSEEDHVDMYPLDFEEFLQVFNVGEPVLHTLRNAFTSKTPVDEMIHRKLMEMFHLYLIIGGMPAAVEKYRTIGSIDDVMAEHRAIIEQYKLDFTQYEEENRKLLLSHIYELIPAELNEKNKRFVIADLKKGLRYDRVVSSFTWLWKAGVALGVFNTTEPTVPLLLNEKNNLFKLFLSDVGLLTTLYGKACKLRIVSKEQDLNKGAVYENVVAQELHAHGYPLYYYNSKKKGELDFVIEHAGQVLPIEVKSGKDYEKHSALDNVIAVDAYGIQEAYVFTNDNVKVDGNLTYFPIYMVMFLQEDPIEFIDISPDRFKL